MNKYVALPLLFLASTSFAGGSQELQSLIRCHEALVDKADAQSFKLSDDGPTPIGLVSGQKVYFYTDTSAGVLDQGFAGKTVTVQLREKQKDFYRNITFNEKGSLGSLSFQEPTSEQKGKSLQPKAQLDGTSLNILKRELIRQISSVSSEYQNKYDPEGTIAALNICKEIDSADLKKTADKQIEFFEKIASKKKGRSNPYRKDTSGRQ